MYQHPSKINDMYASTEISLVDDKSNHITKYLPYR